MIRRKLLKGTSTIEISFKQAPPAVLWSRLRMQGFGGHSRIHLSPGVKRLYPVRYLVDVNPRWNRQKAERRMARVLLATMSDGTLYNLEQYIEPMYDVPTSLRA